MAVDTYGTGVGFNPLYYGTGESAGVDPGAYMMYGRGEGYDELQQANQAWQAQNAKLQALKQVQNLTSTDTGRRWIREHYDEYKGVAGMAGLSEDEMERSKLGILYSSKNAADAISLLEPQVNIARNARDVAKAAYGGDPFENEVKRQLDKSKEFSAWGQAAQGREAVQMDRTGFDADRARELQARTGMTDTEGTLRDWVAGTGPSAAQSQFQSGLDQSVAAQMSAANSARGGAAAMASARNQAAQQGAMQRMQGVSQAASLRAQEMQSAMGQLQQQGYNIRSQDQTRSAQGAEWEQAQSRLSDAQKARNDAMTQYYQNQSMGYEGMRQQAYSQNSQNLQAADRARAQDTWMQRQYRQGMEKDKSERDAMLMNTILGIGGKVAAGAATVAGGALAGPAGAAAAGALTGAAAPATVASSNASTFTGGGGPINAPTQAYGGFNTGGYQAPTGSGY